MITLNNLSLITSFFMIAGALFAIYCNIKELRLHPHGKKRFLRIANAFTCLYLVCIYFLIALEVIPFGHESANLTRVGILVLLGSISASAMMDWGD